MGLHFKPPDGHVGDVIPFYWRGEYHAFYLKRRVGKGTPYAHAVSRDLVHWRELPIAVEVGPPAAPDSGDCWTGSLVERNGVFHLFYTGHNDGKGGYPQQTTCHATSRDLVTWEKDPRNPVMVADPRWYERDDWRDPFVFWNEAEGCYWALITARLKEGLTPRRGCIAVAKSPDLDSWMIHGPLWAPFLVYAPECPDLFRLGPRWYLIFSTMETRFRFADRVEGPWLTAKIDSVDDLRFYAAKTLSDGRRRFLLGWIPSQQGEKDEGNWEWGGHMSFPRELTAQPDGQLAVRCPREIEEAFPRLVVDPTKVPEHKVLTGKWSATTGSIRGEAYEGMGLTVLQAVPDDYYLDVKVTLGPMAASAGFLLRMTDAFDAGYSLTLEPAKHRVGFRHWQSWGDPPPHVQRTVEIEPSQPVRCQVFAEETILEVFINEQVALSARMYNHRGGKLCLIVQNGEARFKGLRIASH
ncbi:MAG: hypothetical protein QW057_01205 [Candidatus Bathyarchaeia archaeon]